MNNPGFIKPPKLQGVGEIEMNAPIEVVWPLISNSKELENWGPPVQKIEVHLAEGQTREGKGSRRTVYAKMGKKEGEFEEIRTDQIEGRKIEFHIYEDTFGLDKFLTDVGGAMEVLPAGKNKTRFIFSFYHRTKGFSGWLMNPVIKMQQKRNRNAALKSLKQYAENLNKVPEQ